MAGKPSRLNRAHIRRHCERAIAQRLGYAMPEAVLNVYGQDDHHLIVLVNSGGNALEIEAALRRRGYTAEQAGSAPDGYGCSVRVGIQAEVITP